LLKLNCDKSLFYLDWFPTLDYNDLIKFTSTWYYEYYQNKISMYDFTLNQIDKYEKIATSKGNNWTK